MTELSYVGYNDEKLEIADEAARNNIKTINTTKNLNTYTNISQIDMSTSNTLAEIMAALPSYSELIHAVGAGASNLNSSLPMGNSAGELRITKTTSSNGGRGIAECKRYGANKVFTNSYHNGAFVGWECVSLGESSLFVNAVSEIDGSSFGKDLLNVSPSSVGAETQKTAHFAKSADDGDWLNAPGEMQGKLWLGTRFVMRRASNHVLVEVHEMFPKAGRIWSNFYNSGSWSGWSHNIQNSDFVTGETIVSRVAEVGMNENIVVYASVLLKKLSATKCDLHISYKIESNDETNTGIFCFISKEKLLKALGLSALAMDSAVQSIVTFTPAFYTSGDDLHIDSAYNSISNMGFTGCKAYLGTSGIEIGRIHNASGSFGSWNIATNGLFEAGTYGQIDFYGITYTI